MILDQAKFLDLVNQKIIPESLKTYSDSLLFYILGYLSISQDRRDILEIGPGGSTYPLRNLSHITKTTLHLVDTNKNAIEKVCAGDFFPQEKVVKHISNSLDLKGVTWANNIGYVHIDGSKNSEICKNDIQVSLDMLQPRGLICQDDYGNNKHPAVTIATSYFVNQGKLKFVVIGDSSAWLCKPEDYDFWLDCIHNNQEIKLLSSFLNLNFSRDSLNTQEHYFFLQSYIEDNVSDLQNIDTKHLQYLLRLIACNSPGYLQMPYKYQSRIGNHLIDLNGYLENQHYIYYIKTVWKDIAGPDWPQMPETLADLKNLESQIKDEIINFHKIDLDWIIPK